MIIPDDRADQRSREWVRRVAKAQAVEEVDYTKYADKAPTDLQERFSDWLLEQVGLEFGTKKEEIAFREGVRLATALRMPFQRSPENQEVLASRRAEIEEERAKPAKKTTAAKKAAPKRAAKPVEVEETEEVAEVEEEAVPARPTKKTTAARAPRGRAATTEPSRPARRPARRRAADETATEAPF